MSAEVHAASVSISLRLSFLFVNWLIFNFL